MLVDLKGLVDYYMNVFSEEAQKNMFFNCEIKIELQFIKYLTNFKNFVCVIATIIKYKIIIFNIYNYLFHFVTNNSNFKK